VDLVPHYVDKSTRVAARVTCYSWADESTRVASRVTCYSGAVRILRSRWFWLVPLAAGSALVILLLASTGDDGEPGGGASPAEVPGLPGEKRESATAGATEVGHRKEEDVSRVARSYVEAIDDRDGGEVCALLAPGAIQGFDLPRERGGCAASLRASIGYRDPRGFPVFDRARVQSIQDVAVAAGEARVTATVVTEFADREQPSIEEDLIYLVQLDDQWLIAKPSSTLYRAVGKPKVPARAIAPPG
jgi:hypothetical protein